jgi:hypothetical protein
MKAQVEHDYLGEDKGSFNAALQRQAERMREQVETLQKYALPLPMIAHDPCVTSLRLTLQTRRVHGSLSSQLKEAQKAQSKAERSLAFQILENDRQHTQMERLKR